MSNNFYPDLKEIKLKDKLNELSTIPLKKVPELIKEEGFNKFILPLFKFLNKNCIELEEATSLKMFPEGIELYYISYDTKKPLPSCAGEPEFTDFQPAYDYDFKKFEPYLEKIKLSKRSKHIVIKEVNYFKFIWKDSKIIFKYLVRFEKDFIETYPEILVKEYQNYKIKHKEPMINIFHFFENNQKIDWNKLFFYKTIAKGQDDEIRDLKEINKTFAKENKKIKDYNITLQEEKQDYKNKLKDKIKEEDEKIQDFRKPRGRPTNINPIEIFEKIIQKREKFKGSEFNTSFVFEKILKDFNLSDSYLRTIKIKKYLSCVLELKGLNQKEWQRIITKKHLEIMKEKMGEQKN